MQAKIRSRWPMRGTVAPKSKIFHFYRLSVLNSVMHMSCSKWWMHQWLCMTITSFYVNRARKNKEINELNPWLFFKKVQVFQARERIDLAQFLKVFFVIIELRQKVVCCKVTNGFSHVTVEKRSLLLLRDLLSLSHATGATLIIYGTCNLRLRRSR